MNWRTVRAVEIEVNLSLICGCEIKGGKKNNKEFLFVADPSLAGQLLQRGGCSPSQQETILCAEMGNAGWVKPALCSRWAS